MRLKLAGSFAEAIKQFQEVLGDSRRKGAVALELGECFQKIKQYKNSYCLLKKMEIGEKMYKIKRSDINYRTVQKTRFT